MRCTSCGNENAYIGFSGVDCPNTNCRHFKGNTDILNPDITSTPSISNPAPSLSPQGPTGATGIATATLTVSFNTTIKANNVIIEFVADGDPGYPNKRVEFLWSMPGMAAPRICTLSSRHTFYVLGIDADGQTTYKTNWLCTRDGIQPNDNWTLEARIT
jgi:hypothetical protein